ncbi:hypothetical protein H5968_06980 [Sphaerospermopsis sp. LEGE 00249]|nr:hypothetical protein [Sphaerospermopsis sp. LEGE 00249]MBC5794897.1 hypothetical protein [Sphaerospermopsis sp. LEGE 00249]
MISSQVEMEDIELLKLYNKGERDLALHNRGMNWRLKPLKIRSKLGEIIP